MGAKRRKSRGVPALWLFLCCVVALCAVVLCVAVGSVPVSFADTVRIMLGAPWGIVPEGIAVQTATIVVGVRLPRVLTSALVGASLSIGGAAMQGLLKNPLADGTTLGVASGASLGAVIAIAFGITIPGLAGFGTVICSIFFAFLAMVLIMALAQKIDYSLSTNTIILVGVIFSMFASSINSLIISFAGDKAKNILFWTMGSFSGTGYRQLVLVALALVICGGVLLRYAAELNAFAVGETNARHVGVDVRRVKRLVLLTVSALIGICVAISGVIAFVGLVVPHMTRMVVGPNHRGLLPGSMLAGGVFLMLADLLSRVLVSPVELPIGVITSFVGSIVFVFIFFKSRKNG